MKILMMILGILGGVYLVLCLWLYFRQSSLVFFPSKTILASPTDYKMTFEDVFLESSNGAKIHGWYIPADSATNSLNRTVLFCHGNGGNISHRLEIISLWRSLGFSVFCFDYQGYGLSQGSPSEDATYADVRASWDYLTLTRNIAPSDIIVLGRSMGAAVATGLVADLSKNNLPTPSGLILEAPFTSVPDMGARLYPFLPVRLLSRITYDNQSHLAKIHIPTLFLHGSDDSVVPLSMGHEVFKSANEPKRFVELSGDHEDTYIVSKERYCAALIDFASDTQPRE